MSGVDPVFRYRLKRYKHPRSKNKFGKTLLVLFALTFAVYIIFGRLTVSSQNLPQSRLNRDQLKTPIASPTPKPSAAIPKAANSLEAAVQKALEGSKGKYGIVIKNLKTKEAFYLDEHHVYEAGSLYKLWIMATTYKQIEAGDLKEDEVISSSVASLNREFGIDPDSAELTSGSVTFTVASALGQMITISHNYAALILTKKIKLSSVALFLQSQGFAESKVGTGGDDPISTPSDIALFFEKLYKGELASKESTGKMMELLKKQELNDKLPKYLPKGTVIAHKTGEIYMFSHDSGIIFSDKGDYIIVVMSESGIPKAAEERIAEISLAVFNYFQNPAK